MYINGFHSLPGAPGAKASPETMNVVRSPHFRQPNLVSMTCFRKPTHLSRPNLKYHDVLTVSRSRRSYVKCYDVLTVSPRIRLSYATSHDVFTVSPRSRRSYVKCYDVFQCIVLDSTYLTYPCTLSTTW